MDLKRLPQALTLIKKKYKESRSTHLTVYVSDQGGARACRGKLKGVSSVLDHGLIIDPPRHSQAPGISLLTQNIELRLVATALGPSIQAVPRANEVKLDKQYSATYQLITVIAMCIKIK